MAYHPWLRWPAWSAEPDWSAFAVLARLGRSRTSAAAHGDARTRLDRSAVLAAERRGKAQRSPADVLGKRERTERAAVEAQRESGDREVGDDWERRPDATALADVHASFQV